MVPFLCSWCVLHGFRFVLDKYLSNFGAPATVSSDFIAHHVVCTNNSADSSHRELLGDYCISHTGLSSLQVSSHLITTMRVFRTIGRSVLKLVLCVKKLRLRSSISCPGSCIGILPAAPWTAFPRVAGKGTAATVCIAGLCQDFLLSAVLPQPPQRASLAGHFRPVISRRLDLSAVLLSCFWLIHLMFFS